VRIVTLLPSATEIVCALGLGDRLAGVSHECDFPPAARGLPVLTAPKIDPHAPSEEIDRQVRALVADGLSVYRIDEERLRALAPDLIVTQDACEVCAVSFAEVQAAARRLLGVDAAIVSLSPLSLDDVLEDIRRVGRAAGAAEAADSLSANLRARLDRLRAETAPLSHPRTVVLEWLAPPMAAGHWTPELIRIGGGDPILSHDARPTDPIAWERIVEAAPEAILIIPCGFALAQTRGEMAALAARPGFRDLPAVRAGRVTLIDGNAYFNRPGPRLVESAELAALALHPDRFAGRFPHATGALEIFR
jgi:iron complex transport system substrate-binding protein